MPPSDADLCRALYPRFSDVVIGMAKHRGSLNERLGWFVVGILVIPDQAFPADLLPDYLEFVSIVASGQVPQGCENHPHPPKTQRAYYLNHRKAERLAELIVAMFEAIVEGMTDPDA